MNFRQLGTFLFLAVTATLTIIFGIIGWMAHEDLPEKGRLSEALYRTALAFSGEDVYFGVTSPELRAARVLGLLTTGAAIFGLVWAYLGDRIAALRARLRRGHVVLLGATPIALDRAERRARDLRRKLTVLDGPEALGAIRPECRSTLSVPVDPDDATAVSAMSGRPVAMVFGHPDAVRNLKRARALTLPDTVELRIEDGSLSRDLALLSPELAKADVFSTGHAAARALVTTMRPTELAVLRGQDRVHIALIGLGSAGLAIIEELCLRCHRSGLARLRVSIFDIDSAAARARMARERPGLDAAADLAWHDLDGLQCGETEAARPMTAAEDALPLTAIIVATGDPTCNAGIAMRLRQVQRERLRLKAPIFVRTEERPTEAAFVSDLTGGLFEFGGRRSRLDAELDRFEETLAAGLHSTWLLSQPAEVQAANQWQDMPFARRRSSYRAALSALEQLVDAGLLPDTGTGLAGLRVPQPLAHAMLGEPGIIERLGRVEHDRWLAEKLADGYRTTNGARDEEKKLHPQLLPWDKLAPSEQQKDRAIVRNILERCGARHQTQPGAPAWRKVLRVGLYGPIATTPDGMKAAEALGAYLDALPLPLECYDLEIVSPNAPGFDRLAATAMARLWHRRSGRKPRLLMVEAASEAALDALAAGMIDAAEIALQSRDMRQATEPPRRLDMRPPGVSDTDLAGDKGAFDATVERVNDRINALADLVVAATPEGRETFSSRALGRRRNHGGSAAHVASD